ncbi:hypothetical protein ACFPM3_30745 [Streptomyces coeruleoprunus]|uniref:Uncharacterized protein n=1 Tax=Streptomyces coeruleoprunus TaxID=285563 RepID=A0ABV9XQI2_9ACTN
MPARTSRTPRTPAPAHPARLDVRLPWWALALPAAAFACLLLLITGSGEARADAGDPAVGRVLEQIRHTLARSW